MTELERLASLWEDYLPAYDYSAVAKDTAAELRRVHGEVERLRALIRLDDAEWRDKHIHPCGGESFQSWLVSIYLPVPLSDPDKSPEAALERALKEPK